MRQISLFGQFSKWPPIKVHENRKKCTKLWRIDWVHWWCEDDVTRREFCSANYSVQHEVEGFYEEGVRGWRHEERVRSDRGWRQDTSRVDRSKRKTWRQFYAYGTQLLWRWGWESTQCLEKHKENTESRKLNSFWCKNYDDISQSVTSRKKKKKKSFTRISVSIWNSIPLSLKSLNKSAYQNKIKKLLLDFLNCEDDYIEVSKLIKHFATLTWPVLYSYYLLVFLPSSFFRVWV